MKAPRQRGTSIQEHEEQDDDDDNRNNNNNTLPGCRGSSSRREHEAQEPHSAKVSNNRALLGRRSSKFSPVKDADGEESSSTSLEDDGTADNREEGGYDTDDRQGDDEVVMSEKDRRRPEKARGFLFFVTLSFVCLCLSFSAFLCAPEPSHDTNKYPTHLRCIIAIFAGGGEGKVSHKEIANANHLAENRGMCVCWGCFLRCILLSKKVKRGEDDDGFVLNSCVVCVCYGMLCCD